VYGTSSDFSSTGRFAILCTSSVVSSCSTITMLRGEFEPSLTELIADPDLPSTGINLTINLARNKYS